MRNAPRIWQPDFPFRPDRVPFFYGWVVMLAMTVGVVMSLPGQTMGVSVFTDIFIETLGLSRVRISFAYLLGTAASGFLLPWGGAILDRFGERRTAFHTAWLFGLVVIAMGQCDRIAAAIGGPLPPGASTAVAFAVITIGFFALRFLGQGMLTVSSRAMLGKWFARRRGLTLALSGTMISFSFSVAPKFLDSCIQALGWRGAYLALGSAILVGMTLFAWLIFRDTPEECGLEMDGGPAKISAKAPNADFAMVREMTRPEAIRTFAFWAFNIGTAWQALLVTAYTFHIVSIGAEAGLAKETILHLFLPIAGVGLAMNFLSGLVADRTKAKYVLALLAVGMAIASMGMLWMRDPLGRALLVCGLGTSGGAFQSAIGVVWPRFYGRKHLGAISGFNMSTIVLASAAGPFLFSVSQKFTGDYHAAYVGSAIATSLLAATAFFADNPQRKLLPPD